MHVSSAYRPKSAHAGDPLSCYLREISAYPLLSLAEEIELSERARAGVSSATERLVCANLRFVVSVAKKFQNQGVQLADLINEGNLGLVRAADSEVSARRVSNHHVPGVGQKMADVADNVIPRGLSGQEVA